MHDASGSKPCQERRILGIVRQLRFLFSVQVIEIAEEFVEAVKGRQVLIPVSEMVLAKLAGGIAERLQQFSDGRVLRLKPDGSARHADFGQAGSQRVLAADKGSASSGAALLAVPIGESHPFFCNSVYVGRLVA